MNMERAEMTERILAAIENPYTQIIAHPTGRLVLRREPFEYDMEKVLDAAAKHGVAMECNAAPERLDLNDIHLRMAKQRGVKIVISTDAHSTRGLLAMKYGVHDRAARLDREKRRDQRAAAGRISRGAAAEAARGSRKKEQEKSRLAASQIRLQNRKRCSIIVDLVSSSALRPHGHRQSAENNQGETECVSPEVLLRQKESSEF